MDISKESSEPRFRVLIIGGGRWSNVYICELLSMPYSVSIDIVSETQASFLKSKYGSRVSNYYLSCDNILRNEKYDLAVIANQPSRRVEDISNACNFTNSLLIEKPVCETVQQYIDLKKLHQYKKIRSCIWTISCPFIYSQMVSDFFQYNEDPETIYCRWDEKLTNDRAYRLDKNVTSTAISHFLPLLSAYVEFNYESLLVDYKQKGHIRLVSKNSFKPNINIAWSRRNQTTEKKIFLRNRGSMAALNLMNQELKQIGIYKVSEKSLSPLQSQVHALLDLKDSKYLQSMRFENQSLASEIFLLNLD